MWLVTAADLVLIEKRGSEFGFFVIGIAAEAEHERVAESLFVAVGFSEHAIGESGCSRLHEGAVHQVESLDGDIRGFAVAGDEAWFGEVEQVEHIR